MLNCRRHRSRTERTTENYVPLTVSCDDEGETDQYAKENIFSALPPQSPPSPTSPFSPSPRRLRLERAPDITRSREAQDNHTESSSFATPNTKEQQIILVECLVCGSLRTTEVSWFPNASAWFPAELHQVHRERATPKIWAQVLGCVFFTATVHWSN